MRIKKSYLLYIILLVFISSSCKKFVDVTNPDTLTDPSFWKNENSVRSYNWEFYNMFNGYGNGSLLNGDFYFTSFSDDQAAATFTQYPLTTATTNGDWSFSVI